MRVCDKMAGIRGIVYASVVLLIAVTLCESIPVALDGHYEMISGGERARRRTVAATERDCTAVPPVLPDTINPTGPQLVALRAEMVKNNVAAYIIPSEDPHGSEYVPAHDERRGHVSGFTGSAGIAIVTATEAVVWVDGRYFLQVTQQIDCNWDWLRSGSFGDDTPTQFLTKKLADGAMVGFDPALMSVSTFQSYEEALKAAEGKTITMKQIADNLIDEIWDDQPPYNVETVITVLPVAYTGESWQDKVRTGLAGQRSIVQQLGDVESETIEAFVISKLDEIAWLFNLRGQDVLYNPMFVSYAIVTTTKTTLYLYDSSSTKRVPAAVKTHLNVNTNGDACLSDPCVLVKHYDTFFADLTALAEAIETKKIWISDRSSYAIYSAIREANRYVAASPILIMKAVKSETEALGMEQAHAMDSIALCNLGAWMQEKVDSLEDPMVGDIAVISEGIVMEEAIKVREAFADNRGLSFGTISGFGPHGAIIHYESSPETDVPITKDGTFLLDSGGQYLQGTCDITRTFHFGEPTAFMKEAYTRVLLGSFDLAMAVFRDGIYGRDIDAIARNQLWSGGLDYNHGTGHGIGHFLNVHEGPARIRYGVRSGEKPMERNMFFSDEPGYYEANEFGIRIESIVRTVPAVVGHDFQDYDYTTFKMISMVPFEPSLIDLEMFTNKQLEFLNTFNRRIRDEIGDRPELTAAGKAWMMMKTEPVEYVFMLGSGAGFTAPSMIAILGALLCASYTFLL